MRSCFSCCGTERTYKFLKTVALVWLSPWFDAMPTEKLEGRGRERDTVSLPTSHGKLLFRHYIAVAALSFPHSRRQQEATASKHCKDFNDKWGVVTVIVRFYHQQQPAVKINISQMESERKDSLNQADKKKQYMSWRSPRSSWFKDGGRWARSKGQQTVDFPRKELAHGQKKWSSMPTTTVKIK